MSVTRNKGRRCTKFSEKLLIANYVLGFDQKNSCFENSTELGLGFVGLRGVSVGKGSVLKFCTQELSDTPNS